MAEQKIKIILVADAKQATEELKKAAKEVERTGEAAKKGEQGFKQFGSSLDETTTKLKNLLTPANLVGGALGVGLVAGLRGAVRAATDYGDQLTRLQIITGSSVRDLAVLKDAAGKAGVSFEALQRGLFFLANEAQTAGESLIELGISARNEQNVFKDGVTILLEAADKISQMSDATQRAAASKKLLSRGAIELIPLLSKTSAELRAMGVDGERLAKILGEAGVGPLKLLKIALGEVGSAVEENLIIFVKDLTPALKAMADSLAALIRLYQKLPDEIRVVITVLGLLSTALLFAAAAAKAFSIAMTLPIIAGIAKQISLIPTAVGVAILELGKLKALLLGLGVPIVIAATVALIFDVAGIRSKLTEQAASLAESFGSIFSKRVGELLADAVRAAIAFALGDPLTEMILGAKKPEAEQKKLVGPSPRSFEELQKELALTKLLTQAQIVLGQVTGNTTEQQITAINTLVELQIKELDIVKNKQFLMNDSKEVAKLEQLKVTLRAAAAQQIDRLIAEEKVAELEHNATLEKLVIERFQTGEEAARNTAVVEQNLANRRLKIFTDLHVLTLADEKAHAKAIEASETALTASLNKSVHERFKVQQETAQAEADSLMKAKEQTRDLAIEIVQDDVRLAREALEDKLIAQRDYANAAITAEDDILAARITLLKSSEMHLRESAERQIAIVKHAIDTNQADEALGALQIDKIWTDLNASLADLGRQRKEAYKANREAITSIERDLAKLDADFLAKALQLDSKLHLDDLDRRERANKDNAKVILEINADRFRTQRQMYDQDVQTFIDAELLKTGILTDELAKRLAKEAGVINQVKQFTQQKIDNAATVLLQQAREAGDLGQAFAVGFAHAATSAEDALDRMAQAGANAFREMGSGLSDFLFDAITGAKSMGDAFLDVGKRILRSFLDLFTQIAAKQVAMALGFNVVAQATPAFAGQGGGAGAGSPDVGGIGSFLQQFPLLSQLLQIGGSGAAGFGLGSLIFGSGGGGIGASIGSMVGTLAGMIVPGLTFAIGSFISALIPSLAAGLAALGVAAPIALIGNFVLPGIGLIIGGLVGFLIDLFTGPPTARLYVNLKSDFITKQEEFLKGMIDSFDVNVSADMPKADAVRLGNEIIHTLSDILRQLMGSLVKAGTSLPSSIMDTIMARLAHDAANNPRLIWGETEFNLEKPEELKAAIEALPNKLITIFTESTFGIRISEFQREGEELSDTFIRILNSMVGFSEVLSLFGNDVDALARSLAGESSEALRLFLQRSIDFFEQFQKEGEKFEDTMTRVVQAFGGMRETLFSLDQRLATLSDGSGIRAFQASIAHTDAQLVQLADRLTVAFETGAQPDEILTMVQQLTDATAKRYQSEIEFVSQLAQTLEALKVSGGQFLLQLQTQIATLALQTGQGFGQFGLIGEFAPSMVTKLGLPGQLAVLPGLIESLRQAALGTIEQGGPFGGLFAGRQQLVDFGQGLFERLKTEKDPKVAFQGLQQLAAGVTQLLAGEIEASDAYFTSLIAQEQEAADVRLKALDAERSAIQDTTQAIQDQIAAIKEAAQLRLDALQAERDALRDQMDPLEDQIALIKDAAEARLDPLKAELEILQAETRVLEQQRQSVQAWADVIDSVNDQLLKMRTTLDNPENALERLRYVQELTGSARERFLATPTPETAREFQDLLQQELQLGQEAFQRPSNAYQAIFDQVSADLQSIQAVAESNAGDLEGLTRQIAERQARIETLTTEIAQIEAEVAAAVAPLDASLKELQRQDALLAREQQVIQRETEQAVRPLEATLKDMQRQQDARLRAIEEQETEIRRVLADRIAVLQAEQAAAIHRFRAEAGGWLQTIRDEALRRLEEATREGDDALRRLLGDKSLEQFIADKNAEQAARLTEIRDALLSYLGRQGFEVAVTPQRMGEAAAGLRILAELAQGGGQTALAQALANTSRGVAVGDVTSAVASAQAARSIALASPLFQTEFGARVIGEFTTLIGLVQTNQFQTAINALGSLIGLIQQAGFTARAPVPGFQHGLSYVPYDEFPARLHRGERVLTAPENVAYSRGQGGLSVGPISITLDVALQDIDPRAIAKVVKEEITESFTTGRGKKILDRELSRKR